MVRSGATRLADAAALIGATALPAALLTVIRAAPRIELTGTHLGWVPAVASAALVATATVLAAAALVAGLRRGSIGGLIGSGAAAAVAGAALVLALSGRAEPMTAALPVAALLGVVSVLVGRRRPALPGRRARTLVAAAGLVLAEGAVLAGTLPGPAGAVAALAAPLLIGAAITLGLVSLLAVERWRASAAAAAGLGALALALDRDGSLELLFGLMALIAAGLVGIRSALGPRTAAVDADEEDAALPPLAGQLADGILRFDGRLTLTDWNPAAARLLGLGEDASGTRLEDLLGVTLSELPSDERPRVVETAIGGLELRLHRARDGVVAVLATGRERPDQDRLGHELRGTIEELLQARRTIELQRAELERLSTVDPLTGVASRGAILERLRSEIAQARRYRHPVAVVLLDVDDFAGINRHHGVAGGDALLREVALRMRLRVREADALGRAGSDGFLAILPHTDEEGAAIFAEALRGRLAQRPLPVGDALVQATASIGVAVMRAGETIGLDDLLGRAAEALERARSAGGDRIALDRQHGLKRLDDRRGSQGPAPADHDAV